MNILVDENRWHGSEGIGKLIGKIKEQEERQFPCVVFSHGMAGMSQSYSHYLGSIASHGVVVAAIEHRDGSGPGTIIHYPDGRKRTVWHMKVEDLEYVLQFNSAACRFAILISSPLSLLGRSLE